MRLIDAILWTLAATLPCGEALSLYRRQDGPPRVVHLNLQRNQIPDPVEYDKSRLRRRSGTISSTIDNLGTLYFLNASVGTPPQDVRFHLDTGSSDLWMNTPGSSLCHTRANPCAPSGMYTANSSSTYKYLGSYFNISYVDGSGASGDYATDIINVSGNTIPGFQFGIGYVSTSNQNIVGIGYTANEVQVTRVGMKPYNNLPASMVAQGLIASNVYSLWLDDLQSNTGNILFGGIDQAKYKGSLVTLPIEKVGPTFSEFFITMTGLSVGSTSLADDQALAVLLDSGSSLTYLPNQLVTSIYDKVNASYQDTQGVAFVPCSLGSQNANMTFQFSSPASIAVPMSELVLDLSDSGGRQLRFNDGVPACLFGIAPAGDSTSVLGDTFLRSAYVVYDLDNNEISLAQSNFNATSSNVVEIQKGTTTLPSAVTPSKPVLAQSGLPGNGKATQSGGSSNPASHVSAPGMFVGVVTAMAVLAVYFI